ncbi:hypothetical protein [Hymenobacter sp. HDW8]|uniref:hypothetical protein n=1 Tax=Hymenobacter sp. HDW8 TaxID=2714932 RepID=UPI0014074FC6|nr:hypothetical protein [Hymenobacter sp. HDW8]QIL78324.1 hypothetical protein G7064_21140 [Hymenobacter sp. HDW8]
MGHLLELRGLPFPAAFAQGVGYGLRMAQELVPRFFDVDRGGLLQGHCGYQRGCGRPGRAKVRVGLLRHIAKEVDDGRELASFPKVPIVD